MPHQLTTNPYTFTSRRSDPETDLLYFRARYYDAEIGRFIGRDPLGYVDGMSLYGGYFGISGVDPSGTIWRQVKKNIYEAEGSEDFLMSLAWQITGDNDDWVCIWPIKDDKKWSGYPWAKKCAQADVSNLVDKKGGTLNLGPSKGDNFIKHMRPELKKRNNYKGFNSIKVLSNRIKSASGEGKKPLQSFSLLGHCGSGNSMGNAKGLTWTVEDLFSQATEKNNFTNSYKAAIKKIGPPRCWFCRNVSHTRFYGCNTNTFASTFASIFLRGQDQQAFGTTRFVQTTGPPHNQAFFANARDEAASRRKHNTLQSLESETAFWQGFSGQ